MFYGALVMFIFGISTISAMFSLGFLSSLASATNFRNIMMALSSVAIYSGYEYISNPHKTLRDCCKVESN